MIKPPYEDRVIIEPDKAPDTVKSDKIEIIIPDKYKDQHKDPTGIVVAVGPGKNNIPMPCQVGDHVVYGKYAGTEWPNSEGRTLIIVRISEVMGPVS